jgi:hypothetical protein
MGDATVYPSGTWRGHWDQEIFGRQPMGPLVLRFHDGRIQGEGRDIVGPFTFSGEYDEHGRVRMVKQYHGRRRHQVFYVGTYDGEGTIFGEWRIPSGLSIPWASKGSFALSPVVGKPSVDAPIEDL